MRPALFLTVIAGLMLASSSLPSSQAQESPIVAAMRDELKRSMSELRLKDEPAPYYIDYLRQHV